MLLALVLVLVGVVVLLYPVVATELNNANQKRFAAQYDSQVQEAAPESLARELARADLYNARISGAPILDPYLDVVEGLPASKAYDEYLHVLNSFDALARVRVPGVGIDLPVYHGTTQDTLARGVGHLYGTALPVGGTGTHSVLTSHTGMSNATLFDHLVDVKEGDLMYVDVYGKTLAYEVDSITVVLPTEIDALRPVAGKDLLTLFTCTPYAVNTHRLLVTGHRVPFAVSEPGPADASDGLLHLEPWMWALIAGGTVVLTLVGVAVVREARRWHASGFDSPATSTDHPCEE